MAAEEAYGDDAGDYQAGEDFGSTRSMPIGTRTLQTSASVHICRLTNEWAAEANIDLDDDDFTLFEGTSRSMLPNHLLRRSSFRSVPVRSFAVNDPSSLPSDDALPAGDVSQCDRSPSMPAVSIRLLIQHVDVSQYHQVTDDEMNSAQLDYGDDEVSPCSVATAITAPYTPDTSFSNCDHDTGPFTCEQEQYATTSIGSDDGEHGDSMKSVAHTSIGSMNLHRQTSYDAKTVGNPHARCTTNDGHSLSRNRIEHRVPNCNTLQCPMSTEIQGRTGNKSLILRSSTFHSNEDRSRQHLVNDCNKHTFVEDAERACRDEYLLSMRRKRVSYKEIKRRGGFMEAESTLRGRVRMLTKDKAQRVRRPEWTDHDIELLRYTVDEFESAALARDKRSKLPWKQISERIKEQGSSYDFAPATCSKKWEQLKRMQIWTASSDFAAA